MNRLRDKVAIITGSSSGMGRETAKMFAAEGAKVITIGRRKERLDELVRDVRSAGGEIDAISGDLMEPSTADLLVDFALNTYGKVDVLMNNAGIIDLNYSEASMPDEIVHDAMETNFMAPFRLCRRVLNVFDSQGTGGVIINVSSICGVAGARGGPMYTASKHALIGLTKNIAYVFATKNVRCNAICPGWFPTEVLTRYNGTHRLDCFEASRIDLVQESSKGMGMGDLAVIGNLAIYLASDESHYVNGAAITIDGGWTCA